MPNTQQIACFTAANHRAGNPKTTAPGFAGSVALDGVSAPRRSLGPFNLARFARLKGFGFVLAIMSRVVTPFMPATMVRRPGLGRVFASGCGHIGSKARHGQPITPTAAICRKVFILVCQLVRPLGPSHNGMLSMLFDAAASVCRPLAPRPIPAA